MHALPPVAALHVRLAPLLLLSVGLLASQAASAVVFSDGTFANGNWTATVTTQTGGASSIVDGQQATGGDPGAWRKARHVFTGAGLVRVYHERQGMSFDPSTLVLGPGEMLVLDYSEDRIEVSPPFVGAAVGAAPALKQDGIVYAGPEINYSYTSWATGTLTNLSAAEFTPYGGSGHPDFSPSGSPITFGYYRTNSNTGGSSFTITHGIDDWSFTTRIADIGTVVAAQKISDTEGGFTGTLANIDRFGECVEYLGDVDGDGIGDLATSTLDDGSATDAGAIWILFMNADDTVKGYKKIAYDHVGGFVGVTGEAAAVAVNDRFGQCGEGIGDLNYDGVPDLAVGSEQGGDGAVWILFLNSDGTVRSERRIGSGDGGFPTGQFAPLDQFGREIARLGDVDGDGVVDLAVDAPNHAGGGTQRGVVFVLFMEPDGHVKDYAEISGVTVPALGLADGDKLGLGMTGLGDLDGDGVPDLAAAAFLADDDGVDAGAVYVLLLNADGSVKSHQKLTGSSVGGGLEAGDRFGIGLANLGDLDGDGVQDLGVGASRDDDGGMDYGAAYVIFLNADGSAKDFQKISRLTGGLNISFNTGDEFGMAVEGYPGADGAPRFAVGARQDDDGGTNRGAIHVLTLAGVPRPTVCGDFVREGAEECDDGNTLSGDTCSASCEAEEVLFLRGTASGGNVQVTVSGELVSVATGGGQTAEQVLAALAAAIEANVTLQGLGVEATAAGQVLYTTGAISAPSTSDAGLTVGERDDLVLAGSTLDHPYPYSPLVDQNVPSLPLTVAATGGFALPADLFTRPDFGHAPIVCARQATATSVVTTILPLTIMHADVGLTQEAGIRGTGTGSDVRCTGALSGFYAGAGSNVLDLAPVGAGGTVSFKQKATSQCGPNPCLVTTFIARVGGAPWTLHRAWGDEPTPATYTYSTGYTTMYLAASRQWRRGIEARRADGIGVLNPVAPMAFQLSLKQGVTWSTVGQSARFAELHLRFVPEPALALGMAAGALALVALRRRSGPRAGSRASD